MKHRVLPAFCLLLSAFCSPLLAVDWDDPESVVRAAVEANPSLAALSAQARAAQERVGAAGSLPNPMLMTGVQNQTVDLSYDFMTMYMVGASQTLVRKSRRQALRKAAELDVEGLRHEYDARKAEVERDARTAYIDAAAAQNQVEATVEIARLLKLVTGSAKIQYETGMVPQADLIRAMLEESRLEHQLITLRRQRKTALARLLPLLHLPPDTAVSAFSLKHEMASAHDRGIDSSLPVASPAFTRLQNEVERADEDVHLAKLSARPDINIEASYGFRPRDTDMINLIGRVELPIRRSTLIEPRIREAQIRREIALQLIESLRQQLQQDLGAAVALRNEAIEQINLHVDKLVPTAKLGFESALASYQSGKTTFDAVLESLRTYLALNVDYYDFLRQQMDAEEDIDAIRRGARGGIASASAMTTVPTASTPAAMQ